MTAGSGIEGAGEADLLTDGEEPNEDRRLWLIALGGFIGRASVVGVPGADGAGDAPPCEEVSVDNCDRRPISGGAGLEILREGKSILA